MASCPECGAELQADAAVLCLSCGYHLRLGRRLETEVVASRDLSNPFVPPAVESDELGSQQRMTEAEAEVARAVADGAMSIYLSSLLSLCVCGPILVLLLPLYVYRYFQWMSLRADYPQLRKPNSLSPYAEIEVRFEDAGLKYLFSIGCGLAWLFFVLVAVAAGTAVAPK